MDYSCYVCDEAIKTKFKNKHLQSITPNEFDKCIRVKFTIENHDVFDIDEKFKEYITNHNKKFDLQLAAYEFKPIF